MATTPHVKRKYPSLNTHGNESATCPIYLDPIIDTSEDTEGQEAIYCKSTFNGWIHRQSAGPSQIHYKAYQDGDDPLLPTLSLSYSGTANTRAKVNH